MPRINIEESIWSDPRFLRLCLITGDEEKAVGRIVIAWRLAQKYWIPDKKDIPNDMWNTLGFGGDLILAGLAKKTKDGIYLIGSEEQFSWLIDGVEQRRQAGKRSAEARRIKFGTAQPCPERAFERSRTRSNELEPSSSSSKTKPNTLLKSPRTTSRWEASPLAQQAERVYQEFYPRKEGKRRGMQLLAKTLRTPEDLERFKKAVANYAESVRGREPEYVKHFSTFAGCWEDYEQWIPPRDPSCPRLREVVSDPNGE